MTEPEPIADAGYRPAGAVETVRANRSWWDRAAAGYLREHGDFLSGRLVWGPEGLTEDEAGLLGDVAGRTVVEIGSGAAQCGAWLAGRGAQAVSIDLSIGMLRAAARRPGLGLLQADGRRLPLPDGCADVAFTAYGALPFVADPERILAEVFRVLRSGARWVFAVPHPVRWAFPDDPGPEGLTATRSYFDRTPYVESGAAGQVSYAEHHATLGDWVRMITGAGFRLLDLVEPQWPDAHRRTWGGWSPLRGRLLPGTAIFVTSRP